MIQQRRSIVGFLLIALCGLVVVAFSKQSAAPTVDTNTYQEVMSAQIADIYDLEQYFVDQQYTFLPIVPPDPDFTLVQSDSQVLPFDWKTFPTEFKNLVPQYENSVPVYPVTIIEDPATREIVFLNADGDEIYAIAPAKDYNPYAFAESLYPSLFLNAFSSTAADDLRRFYDPARIQIETRLIPQEYVEDYLYVKDQITAALSAEVSLLSEEGIGGMMLMRSGEADSNIVFEVIARTNTGIRTVIGYPNDFTNRLDVFTCNDLMQYVWVFATKGLSTSGTNEITWVDTNYWVNLGQPIRFYSAGNSDLDTDNDGYSDASEIMVYRTDHTASNSRPIRISGTVSYSGIETGTIRVLSTTVSSSWSIAQSVALSGPGAYSNDIGNNQSYWFKAFRDVNSSYTRDNWEPYGLYSVNATLITNDTTGLNITMQDQPSLWGAVDYEGAETGNVYIVAVTGSDSWSTTYSSMSAWEQGGDPMTGGVNYLTFPASFGIAGMPVSNYWLKAFIDTNYDGAYTEGEVAGQYTSNAIPVSNRMTGLNFTINHDADGDSLPDWWEWQHGTDANNPDTDGDGFTDGDEVNNLGTDPLNRYSVPSLSMLSASGKNIVDTNGNAVLLKSVNLGGWLVFENWMMKFLPTEFVFTNYALNVVVNDFDESNMRQMLVQNVDYEIVLVATSANTKVGTSIENCTPKPSIGSFDPGDYIGFSSVNFGTGVSNLTAVLAVDSGYAGKWIDVRLDNPSSGALVGSILVEGTKDWCTPGAQTLQGLTNCTGTHAVYFVGRGASGGIGNLVSFRFYRDTNARQLIETFRNSYIQTNDLDRIREFGYNCVRVPFSYSLIQAENGTNYLADGWNRLDWLLNECAKRRIWVLLDLHSTPGGQNWYEHSGQPDGLRNRLWTNPKCQDKTAHLWNTVAARYSNNTTVAGYDLFNEPNPEIGTKEQSYSNYIVPLHDRLYKSIRSNDTRHLIFMEDNWHATSNAAFAWNHPRLQDKGWSNVVFEFHNYEHVLNGLNYTNDWYFETQKDTMDENVRLFTAYMEERQVPVFVGEFCPGDPRNMEYFVRRFNASGINWAHWNYRNWGWDASGGTNNPWTGWGLDYRTAGAFNTTNSAIQPNVRTDTVATLSAKLSGYNYQNYTDHSQLRKVIQTHAASTNIAKERTQFYLNTFNGLDALSYSAGCSWKKIAALGNPAKFWIQNSRARVIVDAGPLTMRFRTREELDARFEVNDSTGCWFSFEPWTFTVTNIVATNECELRLSVMRDEINKSSFNYNCPGIIARLLYDRSPSATNVTLCLFSKNGGTNTYGLPLYQSAAIPFVAGEPLRLFVNQTSATIIYATVTNTVTHTNLALDSWADGAVCAVEAENNGGVSFVELDNFRAWRSDASTDVSYTETFSNAPNGMTVLSSPERTTMQGYYAASRQSESYITNSKAIWFPKEQAYGATWMSPRRDYQNDVRLDLSGSNVVELRADWDGFASGWGKVCLLPEFFTGNVYDECTASALYVELERTGSNIKFTGFRHTGVGGGRHGLYTNTVTYVAGRSVSLQVSTNAMSVYYGSTAVISNVAHGLNIPQVYSGGAFPHMEFQNYSSPTVNSVLIDNVVCRKLATFEAPTP